MAVRKMTEGVSGWNSKTPFPKDRYQIVCLEEDFGDSKSSGNPMLTQTFEIVAPEIVQVGDRKISVVGLKATRYLTIKVKEKDNNGQDTGAWDVEKSEKAFGRYRDELLVAGFDPDGEIDDENPPIFFKGKTFDAIVSAKKDVARKSPTPEQLRKGQKQGEPILDANGKQIESYNLQIDQILGLSTTQVDVAY